MLVFLSLASPIGRLNIVQFISSLRALSPSTTLKPQYRYPNFLDPERLTYPNIMALNQSDTQNTKPVGSEYIPPHERRKRTMELQTGAIPAQGVHTTEEKTLPPITENTNTDKSNNKSGNPHTTTTPPKLENSKPEPNEPHLSTPTNAKAEALHDSSPMALHHEPREFRNSPIHATGYGRLAPVPAATIERSTRGTMTEKRKARGTMTKNTVKAKDGPVSHTKAEALRETFLWQGLGVRKADVDFGRLSPVGSPTRLDRQKDDSSVGWD
jgi:hypothetical protein